MRSIIGFAVFLALANVPVGAQTINGESNYEDNYYHVPPDGGTKSPVTVERPEAASREVEDARLRGKLYPKDRGDATQGE